MKKIFKFLIAAFAFSSLAMFATGCKLVDKIEGEIDKTSCSHVFDSGVVQKEANCVEAGTSLYTCAVCGETELRVVPQLFHEEKILEKVSPTCTDSGLSSGKICGKCNFIIEEQIVLPALGHQTILRNYIEPTCTEDGKTAEKFCIRCNEVVTEGNPIPSTGHSPIYTVGYAPTCYTYGLTDGTKCLNCNDVYVEQSVLSPIEHHYVEGKCTMCSDVTHFCETLYPDGYKLEEMVNGENALGKVYCLGPYAFSTLQFWLDGKELCYLFPEDGTEEGCFVLPDETVVTDVNLTFFSIGDTFFVQFPEDKLVYTYNGKTYESINVTLSVQLEKGDLYEDLYGYIVAPLTSA